MCRFMFLLSTVLGVFICIASAFGIHALGWTWVIAIGGLFLLNLLIPAPGVHNAFRNLYTRMSLFILLVVIITFLVGMFALAKWLPKDASDAAVTSSIIGILLLALIVCFLVLRPYYPYAQSRLWFRRNFPLVRASILKYQKPGEVLDDNNPVLLIEGSKYFLVPYTLSMLITSELAGYLLLDENGNPIDDADLVRKAMKCKTLALQTYSYGHSTYRASLIDSQKIYLGKLERMFSILKEKWETFDRQGPEIIGDVEQILAAEGSILKIAQTMIDVAMHEAKWAKDHGLGKLVEINYQEVDRFEGEIRQIRQPMLEAIPRARKVAEPAGRLAEAIYRGHIALLDSDFLSEMFQSLAAGYENIDTGNNDVFGTMTDEDWEAWWDRMDWVADINAGYGKVRGTKGSKNQ